MTEYRRRTGVVERRVRGRRVLVPIAGSAEALDSIYSLNETAAVVWECACRGASAAEIVERITSEFAVSRGEAAKDVKDTIAALVGAKLL